MKFFCSKKFILTTSFAVALLVRGSFFIYYLSSPFRHFHKVPGLDMQTLLHFSEWGPGREFSPLFVVHRFLIYLTWLINGREHCIPAIVFIQCLAGAAGAVLTADLVLMLWGKRKAALLAGIFYGLYAPLLLYDFTVLQESVTTFLILLGVWSFFRARRRHFSAKPVYFSGLLLGLCSVGRPVAALLAVSFPVKLLWNKKWKAAVIMTAGVCSLWLAASGFNLVFANNALPFFRVLPYTMEFHTQKAETAAVPAGSVPQRAAESLLLRLPRRAAQFFLAFEMPENLNYYFLRSRLTPLHVLPGPGVLMPFALAGLLLMLPDFRRREGILLMLILLLALPLAARDPIGRYRLHLVPYFILAAACFGIRFARRSRRDLLLGAGALLAALGLNVLFSSAPFIRVSDFVAWGKAQEATKRPDDALNTYWRGWIKSKHSDRAAAVNLITGALRAGNMPLAVRTCREGIAGPAKQKSVYHYYLALIAASARNFDAAEKHLREIRTDEIPLLLPKLQRLQKVVHRKSF